MAEAGRVYHTRYKPLGRKRKMNEFFDTIVKTASVDYKNKELEDFRIAVDTMLKTIMARVNKRGIFTIAYIQPGGSMAEKSSVWKYHWDKDGDGIVSNHNRPFIEFDYLAVLEDSSHSTEDFCKQHQTCPGCIKLITAPVELEQLNRYYSREDGYNKETLKDKSVLNELFWHEINWCLTSSCNCLSFTSDHRKSKYQRRFAFQHAVANQKHDHCDKCTVAMTTGLLRATTIPSNQVFPHREDCSLIFLWTSMANSLCAPDKLLLHAPQHLSSLPIYVDFLPALEYIKEKSSGKGHVHDNFIVPKRCNVCVFRTSFRIKNFEATENGWRKSWCKNELNVFVNKMSDQHRRCFQILKYLLGIASDEYINNYHMKIVVLNHNRTCVGTTDHCSECVLKIFQELRQSYKSKKLISPHTHRNLLRRDGYYDVQERFCEMRLDDLCSLSETDSWKTFVKNCGLCVSSLNSSVKDMSEPVEQIRSVIYDN